ncbi:uncharacterized protein LOC115889337 [Sitophilus oryzae]|uniref:Uncharacterized protein LOC115889337 n=1 Tax=Sitophilus oryzae TaxID=7048 RepID=A0A6J2YQV7_SITOR|nr:uncharacterized protein LOC115889337 [Sitophilus oryzae]
MGESKSDVHSWLRDFLEKRKIFQYKLEVAGKTSKGDGYLGEVTFVKISTFTDRIYHLVIKSAKQSVELRKQTPIEEVFQREMYVYTVIMPAFTKFQEENEVEHIFDNFPRCYGVYNKDRKEAIILQNMKSLKYDIHDRKTPQNLHHVAIVFKNYARFHALSIAMKRQQPEIFKNLTKDMTDLLSQFVIQAGMVPGMFSDFKLARELLKEEDPVAFRKLDFNENDIERALCKVSDLPDGLSVILHGDCWNNNMMFAYENKDKTQPSNMAFIDFQLSSVGSPICDLSYYLYSVADESVLQYFDLILQSYHYHLTNFLLEMGETNTGVTLQDLRRHWFLYGKFGIAMAPFILKIELSESDEVADLVQGAESGHIGDTFNVELKNKDEYNYRVKSVLKHYASFIDK